MNKWSADKPFEPLPPGVDRWNMIAVYTILTAYCGFDDEERQKLHDLMARPGGVFTSELCEAFGLTEEDRKRMGAPFYVKPRYHAVFTRKSE